MVALSVRSVMLAVLLSCSSWMAKAQAQACPVAPSAANALIQLSKSPLVSVDDAYLRMQCLESALLLRSDRRAVFVTTYRRTTQAIRESLRSGAFIDTPWAERYTVLFAEQYRRAFYDWERGATWLVPTPWRIAFSTSRRGNALFVQELLLGINAHVNYDLANALYEVGLSGNRQNKLLDHSLINEILAGTVDAQLALMAEIYAPGLAQLPMPIENLAEDLFNFSLVNGRTHGWQRAVMLADANNGFQRLLIRGLNSTEAEAIAGLMLSPALSPALMNLLRDLERGH